MSDTTMHTGFLRRLRHTPLGDVLRGRATGRLDWRGIVAGSALPEDVRALVARVVRGTRLWRREKFDVAAELVAHFADGLDAGATSGEMIERFGDPWAAARLIRRGKKRNRPLAWHALRFVGWGVVGLIGLYIAMGVYFFAGRPNVSVDYVAKLNERAGVSAATQDAAWPLYGQALLALGRRPDAPAEAEDSRAWQSSRGVDRELLDVRPGHPRWAELAAWLDTHQPALDLVRRASERPALGFVLGRGGSAYDSELYPNHRLPAPAASGEGDFLISVLLPYLSDLRLCATLLAADAALARERGDGARLTGDITGILGIADHATGGSTLVDDLVGIGVRQLALDELGRTIDAAPGLLDDDALRRLAHRISGPQHASDLVGYDGERFMFLDVVQRVYTDDGHGDGRFTPAGIRVISQIGDPRAASDDAMALAVGPAALTLLASRREVTDTYNSFVNRAAANLGRPAREADWDAWNADVERLRASITTQIRMLPINLMLPALGRVHWTAERSLATQEATTVAIALELYRRRHDGRYPQTLQDLAPTLLPSVPADRVNGQPLRYRLVEGKPVIYSVGQDGDDDAGRPARRERSEETQPMLAAPPIDSPDRRPDGDWILYPPPPPPQPTTDLAPMEPGP